MSTRGTYSVRVDTMYQCFYSHYDNYPEGAAEYFKEALKLQWPKQVHGKNMIKRLGSLDGFEFIKCHEQHTDTEYRYEISEFEGKIYVRAFEYFLLDNKEAWGVIFDGLVEEFIEKYKG